MAYLCSSISESITDEILDSLNKANVWTISDFCSMELMEMRRLTGVKFHILKDILDTIKQRYTLPCNDLEFILEKSIRECKMCPTGLPELTQALDGGFQTQEIVEFIGDSESGKTELCYLLCGEILSHYDDYNILYISSSHDFNQEKILNYTKSKAGNRQLDDDALFNCLSRIEVARPTKLLEFVHLLNTLVHSNKSKNTKCIIVDSLSYIIQDDLLDIKTSNLSHYEELVKFSALKRISAGPSTTDESKRREFTDIYLHEVMRLLVNISLNKNVIVVITNSDPQLTNYKSWTNAIDHRVQLTRLQEFSQYYLSNNQSTICRATILKTIHNTSKIGYSIPFAISDEGLFAIRLKPLTQEEPASKSGSSTPK